MPPRICPECKTVYPPQVVACPRCREVLEEVSDTPEPEGDKLVTELRVVFRVPDLAAGYMFRGVLEHQGIHAVLRSNALPGYGEVRRDWATTSWGEILVADEDAEEARAILADYMVALQRGGEVTDEDVE
jgi:uncharacterized protein YbaR (Trm112 family)